jgi:uncharacterized membrane protein
MFDFLFKYPPAVFSQGEFVLLAGLPVWVLGLIFLVIALGLGWLVWRRNGDSAVTGYRPVGIWALQTLLAGLLLFLLWQPALRIATLKPQQNIVAVVVDDSRSMRIAEEGASRTEQVVRALNSGMLKSLGERFQVRLYRLGERLDRLEKLEDLNSSLSASRLGESLKQIGVEAAGLPVGAVVLLSDGADNSGGVDLETLSEIRRHRIPIHTVGFGRENFARDLEITGVEVPTRALADARLHAQVAFRQRGYEKRKARISIRDGGKTIASQEVVLRADGEPQTESVLFNAGPAGAKSLQVRVEPLEREENPDNNSVIRLVNVTSNKPRILYFEGEPRWEFKFIRRAILEDRSLELVTMLRTTQNKIYRQGVSVSSDLQEGFPSRVEELFGFDGIIIGSVEANYFTPAQQELLKQFVDRRGGGLLFLGGRSALGEGGYATSPLADLLPVTLGSKRGTFHREPAGVELTPAGRDNLIARIMDNPQQNADRWKKLPQLADYQETGSPKPGALVFAEALPSSRGRHPLLVAQNYGRGRTAIFATGGSWRWQMQQPLEDQSHETFWQQMLRWLVAGTEGRVLVSSQKQILNDETHISLRAEVRDKTYLPASDARVEAKVMMPDGGNTVVELKPDPLNQGVYMADWAAEKPGSYVAEVTASRENEDPVRDIFLFRRDDGVAEHFRAEQNRELLEKLSSQTGGRYYKASEIARLGKEINYSEAGITVRETRDLWNMPIIFLAALLLRSGEWLLRRKWGVV